MNTKTPFLIEVGSFVLSLRWKVVKMKNTIKVLILFLILIGCATPYQKVGLSGGYSDTRLQENVFTVNFRGNGYPPFVIDDKLDEIIAILDSYLKKHGGFGASME